MNILSGGIYSLLNTIFITVPTVLIAMTGHELAHGWVSMKLGDPTPKTDGRMTLNPLAHIDPLGAILMIFTGFGWAKPVMVNPMYYKDRKKGMALVAVAGPMANLIMAIAALLINVVLMKFFPDVIVVSYLSSFLATFIILNLNFMVFNLIPFPPLDGSRVIGMFLPNRAYYTLMQYERYFLIVFIILSVTGVFDKIITSGVLLLIKTLLKIFAPLMG